METNMTTNHEIMWAITGKYGMYYGSTYRLKKEAQNVHAKRSGKSWKECQKLGDKAIKVKVIPVVGKAGKK
jgi:hypothetical protein